jgi:hypothetical protein
MLDDLGHVEPAIGGHCTGERHDGYGHRRRDTRSDLDLQGRAGWRQGRERDAADRENVREGVASSRHEYRVPKNREDINSA